jgi:hypothetical protein
MTGPETVEMEAVTRIWGGAASGREAAAAETPRRAGSRRPGGT